MNKSKVIMFLGAVASGSLLLQACNGGNNVISKNTISEPKAANNQKLSCQKQSQIFAKFDLETVG